MNKGTVVGAGVSVAAIAIIFGVISVSDDNVMDSPSVEISENQQLEQQVIEVALEDTASSEEEKSMPENIREDTTGDIIEISLSDGVGIKLR